MSNTSGMTSVQDVLKCLHEHGGIRQKLMHKIEIKMAREEYEI